GFCPSEALWQPSASTAAQSITNHKYRMESPGISGFFNRGGMVSDPAPVTRPRRPRGPGPGRREPGRVLARGGPDPRAGPVHYRQIRAMLGRRDTHALEALR